MLSTVVAPGPVVWPARAYIALAANLAAIGHPPPEGVIVTVGNAGAGARAKFSEIGIGTAPQPAQNPPGQATSAASAPQPAQPGLAPPQPSATQPVTSVTIPSAGIAPSAPASTAPRGLVPGTINFKA